MKKQCEKCGEKMDWNSKAWEAGQRVCASCEGTTNITKEVDSMKNVEVEIHPVAYVCVDADVLGDIQNNMGCLADGDGQAILSLEELTSSVADLDAGELKTTLENVVTTIQGKAGDVWFYAK